MKQCNKNLRILFSSIFVTLMISSMSIALACSTIPKSDQNIKSSSLPHNMGVYEYSQTVDAWVLTDSWHDPSANDFPVGPNDYVWTEPGWSSSILLINADPSTPPPNIGGGGGNPPGGPGFQDPKTVNAQKKLQATRNLVKILYIWAQ